MELKEALKVLPNALEPIILPLQDALHYVVSKNIVATINQPPFTKSAMDGYAVKEVKGSYTIQQVIMAGDIANELDKGMCARVMTGAIVPSGSIAVIKQEDAEVVGQRIIVKKDIQNNQYLCIEGEEYTKGTILVNKGILLTSAHLGLCASSGICKVEVIRKPKILFISTGDELLQEQELQEGKIYDSNRYSIPLYLQSLGYHVDLATCKDDKEVIKEMMLTTKNTYDVILTTGGVSVGDKDYFPTLFTPILHRLDYKPGGNMVYSRFETCHNLHLSGNPMAALTTLKLFGLPLLQALEGIQESEWYEGDTMKEMINKSNKDQYIHGKYTFSQGKVLVESVQTIKGNGNISNAIDSNCLIYLPKFSTSTKVLFKIC